MNIYFISGLGADERVFEMLQLSGDFHTKHIHWIEPLPKESLYNYSLRLAAQMDTTEEFILIGMSLGGMVAVEMNKFLSPKKTIIISSVSTHNEYPPLFRMLRTGRIQKITPTFLLRMPSPVAQWFFGIETPREKMLLHSFMKNVTTNYLRWAIDTVLNWQNQIRPVGLVHIHGTSDHIFPYWYTRATIKIKKGGHFMVHNKHMQISKILLDAILGIK